MSRTSSSVVRQVIWLIALATGVRLLLALQVELGNDEVYYWTYVAYPDWSHFDHPLMVGLMGQLFTLNLHLSDDFFFRLGPIVLSALSTWLIFCIGREVKNERAGLFAAWLFTGSVYTSVIGGFSFIPDAPLIFFWLLALYTMIKFLPVSSITSPERNYFLAFGVIAGLAMLSKYQGAFLWISVLLYVLLYNRQWLREWALWLAGMISAVCLLPLLIWNVQNDFISVTFHSARVTPSVGLRLDYFAAELGGQAAYANPVVYVLLIVALVSLRKKSFLSSVNARLLILTFLPVWLVFTSFSLFRATLPHWAAPGFISLMVVAGAYASEAARKTWFYVPAYFLAVLLVIAGWLINYSPLTLGRYKDQAHWGEDDFTQDLFGWDQVEKSFNAIAAREEQAGRMPEKAGIISTKWFPGAHLDFYVAQPEDRKLFLIGPADDLHKYCWVNEARGGLEKGKDYYHIAVSNLYQDPQTMLGSYFEKIEPLDTVDIKRAGEVMRFAFIYRLKKYNGTFQNPLVSPR